MAPSSEFIAVIQFNRSCSQRKSHCLEDLKVMYALHL